MGFTSKGVFLHCDNCTFMQVQDLIFFLPLTAYQTILITSVTCSMLDVSKYVILMYLKCHYINTQKPRGFPQPCMQSFHFSCQCVSLGSKSADV